MEERAALLHMSQDDVTNVAKVNSSILFESVRTDILV